MLSRQSLLRAVRTAAPRQSAILSQTRAFASPASGSDQVKPPVAVYGLDGTYATALVRSHLRAPHSTRISRVPVSVRGVN